MSEKLCGNAVFNNTGHVHKVQAQTGALSTSNLLALRQPENILFTKLALLFSYVFVPLEESRSKNVSSCIRYDPNTFPVCIILSSFFK